MFKLDVKQRLLVIIAAGLALLGVIFWFTGPALLETPLAGVDITMSFIDLTFGHHNQNALLELGFSFPNFLAFIFLLFGLLALAFGMVWSSKYNWIVRIASAGVLIIGGILVFFVGNMANTPNDLVANTLSEMSLGWAAYLAAILPMVAGVTVLVDYLVLRNKL